MSKTRPYARHGAGRDEMVRSLAAALGVAVAKATLNAIAGIGSAEPLTVERAPHAIAPARMAEAEPESRRDESRATYERCLHTYRTVVRAEDAAQPVDDAGAALAFFVAANLNALHDIDATRETLARLERQLAGVAGHAPAWNSGSRTERQFYVEHLAILGVFIAGHAARARTQGPAAVATVRAAARRYLQRVLGLNPDLLTLGSDGLELRTSGRQQRRVA
ncbi:MAG TPA: DUF6683 family protein [Burkholderiaceae bacterium]|nr:DUF6683 family protein [Burkholderiaceae bacterium]